MTIQSGTPSRHRRLTVRNAAKWVAFCILTVIGWLAYPINSDGGRYGW